MPSSTKAKKLFVSKEFLNFIIIGVINAFNGVLFAALISLFLHANAAFIIGYLISLTISYFLNSAITFRESLHWRKYIKFCLSYIPNFIIQNIVVLIFHNWLGWHKIIAFIIAAAIGVPITFILMKVFAFRKINEK